MPLSFQAGLFLAVATLSLVRLLRTVRALTRPRWSHESMPPPPPALGHARGAARPARGRRPRGLTNPLPGGADGEGAPPAGRRSGQAAHGFDWERWFHVAVLWGLFFFCVPFLAGLAAPGHLGEVSAAVDSGLAGGPPRPETLSPGGAPSGVGEDSGLQVRTAAVPTNAGRRSGADRRWGLRALAGLCTAVAALVAATGFAVRRRSVRASTALALCGLASSAAGFVLAGPLGGMLSGARQAARALGEYARAPLVSSAAQAARREGPVLLVGPPECEGPGRSEFLYFSTSPYAGDRSAPASVVLADRRGGSSRREEGRHPSAPGAGRRRCGGEPLFRRGFSVAGVPVAEHGEAPLVVARPHVRLGAEGRELFIEAAEPVLVLGYLKDGALTPLPDYPPVVAPLSAASWPLQGRAGDYPALRAGRPRARSSAGELGPACAAVAASARRRPAGDARGRVIKELERGLFGTLAVRSWYTGLQQIAFGAGCAYFLMVLAASAVELGRARGGVAVGAATPGALPRRARGAVGTSNGARSGP